MLKGASVLYRLNREKDLRLDGLDEPLPDAWPAL